MGDHSKQPGDDNLVLVRELLRTRGLVREHLDSFNYFVNKGIQKIVRANDLVVSTTRPRISVRFSNVRIGKPSVKISEDYSGTEDTTPMACRLSNQTYAAPIIARVEYNKEPVGPKKEKRKQAPEEEEPDKIMQNNVVIGRMPVMLRSCRCVLYGQNEDELKDLGECPLDPGGYFVIKGREKVIWIQEHDSENRIVVDTDKEGNFTASVTSSTEEAVNKTVIVMKNHMMWLQMKQFAEEVPLIIVMKAMGMVSHKEILQMMGRDIRISLLLQSSLLDCEKKRVNTQEEALKYLDSKVKDHMYANISSEEGGRAFAVLRDVFLANVPVYEDNLRPKCIYLAVMMRRMMNVILKEDTIDDKNYVGHIRLALSGQLISLFFENTFKAMTTELKKRIDKEGVKRPYNMILSFFKEQFIAGAFE